MMDYEDIIKLPHYEPKFHPRMTIYNRSAQFAPFAALTGYDDKVSEAARLTDDEIELSEDLKNHIDIKLQIVNEHIKDNREITVLYFEKDKRKRGGKYIKYKGIVKKIDLIENTIKFKDNFKINLDMVLDIEINFIKDL
jgi:hypothetical protein